MHAPGTAAQGDYLYRITDRNANHWGARRSLEPNTLSQGATYRLRFYARSSAADFYAQAHFYLWSGFASRIVKIEQELNATDEWVLIEQEVTIDWPGSTRSAAYIDFRAENTDDFDLDAVSLTPVTTQVGWILDPTSLRAETPP